MNKISVYGLLSYRTYRFLAIYRNNGGYFQKFTVLRLEKDSIKSRFIKYCCKLKSYYIYFFLQIHLNIYIFFNSRHYFKEKLYFLKESILILFFFKKLNKFIKNVLNSTLHNFLTFLMSKLIFLLLQ